MIQSVSFYIISVLAVIILSVLVPMVLKRYVVMPVVTVVVMGLAAFIIPNFNDGTNWEPLMGYAVFLALVSIACSVLVWVYIRGRRRNRRHIEDDKGEGSTE